MCKVESRCGAAIAVIAACALSAAGCGKVAAQASPDAAQTADAPVPDAALTWSPFAQVAVNYAGSIRVPVPSGDGLTLYFLADVSSMTDVFDLYSASRASKTAAFDQTEVAQTIDLSGIAFAGARWSAHDTEIWVGNGVGQSEKPFVSLLR